MNIRLTRHARVKNYSSMVVVGSVSDVSTTRVPSIVDLGFVSLKSQLTL